MRKIEKGSFTGATEARAIVKESYVYGYPLVGRDRIPYPYFVSNLRALSLC